MPDGSAPNPLNEEVGKFRSNRRRPQDVEEIPFDAATKPFWGTHETNLKQSGDRSIANKAAAKDAWRLR
jgi:hypothetical protein